MSRASDIGQAAAVSRALARGGRRPLPSGTGYRREGIHVKRTSSALAHVVAGFDSQVKANQALLDAAEILEDAGYTVERVNAVLLRVTGRKEI